MKTLIRITFSVFFLFSTTVQAESVGTAFTYQGQLQHLGSPADGEFDFEFTLYDAELEGSAAAGPVSREDIAVTEGQFSVELDFGMVLASDTAYWLEIGVRPGASVAAHSVMAPRQYLYPAPRSVFAIKAVAAQDADALEGHPASDFSLAIHDHGGGFWALGGNAGTTGADFIGTTDNQPLDLRVNQARALRLEPGVSGPNVLGGHGGNAVAGGASGATVSGGGRALAINQVTADFAAIGGGAGNTASGYAATIGGGELHNAAGGYATIGGGQQNQAGDNAVAGGGESNQAVGSRSTIAGGRLNTASAAYSSIGGGLSNVASGSFAGVGAGSGNMAGGDLAVVGGGMNNDAQARFAAIAGGGPFDAGNPSTTSNRVTDDFGFVGGGGGNTAGDGAGATDDASFATVGGGRQNSAAGGFAVVAGGDANTASGFSATTGGGILNAASNQYATVGGGNTNAASGQYATIGGGRTNSSTQRSSTVGGGEGNQATGAFAAVPGGAQNTAGGTYSLAAGQGATAAHTGSFVWSDSDADPFSSTADDQFLVQAAGGVGIGTNSPSGALHVVGETRFKGNARVLGEDDLVPLGSKSNSDPDCFGIPEVIDKQCLRKPSSIVVVGDTAYTLSNGYNTLTAFDVNDPQQIRVLSMSTNGLMRPTQVMIGGSLAYVANDDGIRALVVFDISGPALTAVGTLEGTANPGKALDVFVAGSFAYLVGREPSPFLAVVDVSDLGNMVVRGSAPTGGRAVHVEGSLAVVADADGNRLAVYDVSDPENPGLIGSSSELAASPSSVYVSGSRAYVTMEGSNALVVYDLNPPASPTVLGSIAGSFVTPVSVVVSGDYAFVASEGQPVTAENSGVTVFDVSDPSAIVTRGSTGLVGMSATSVFVSGNRVFVASECKSEECSVLLNDDGFIVFEFNHLESPTLRAGNLQAGYLDVTDSASVTNGLSVGGGLNAGLAHVGGNLGVGGDFGLGGDLRMLGAIGGEDDFVCTEFNVFDECTSWTDPKLTFTNDIFLDGHRILGSTYVHCPEGQYLSGLDCCGVYEFDGPAVCLPDVTNVSFAESDLAIAVDGNLVPACDAGGCPPAIGGWDLGHPELRWDDIWAANGVIQTSDARLKDNVMPLAAGLEEVMALDPVTFNWKGGSERHTGLIAQHVRQVMPGLVRGGDDPGGMLGINYAELVPVLINALQDLQGEIAGQARTIESLQARLARLE